jgi:hypothetical protein
MKKKDLSLFSLSKITTYEILVDEQLERLESLRFRPTKIDLLNRRTLKKRLFVSKLLGAVIFGILPIVPLLTYFQVLDFIKEGSVSIEVILFASSLLFGIYFVFQFFNFFLMSMLSTMKLMSGGIFEWIETLPFPRQRLKKLMLITIIRSLDIPLIVITISLPLIMFLGTQNILILIVSLVVTILNTLFSICLLILLSERMNRVLNINALGSRRTHLIRVFNLVSYILIVIGSVFLVQWALSSIEVFFLLFRKSKVPLLIILILSMIPFPIAPGYLISSLISPQEMTIQIWINIIIGFVLFLILTYFLYLKSIQGVKKSTFSKFKIEKEDKSLSFQKPEKLIRIKVQSKIWAYIKKDLLIATRDLKFFLTLLMPIVIGFIFTFTYNLTNLGGINPFEVDLVFNIIIIIGLNIIISGMIVNGILEVEDSGSSIMSSLPLIPREQSNAKLILMGFIQSITVLAPSLMYIGRPEFTTSFFIAIGALPFTLLFLIFIFELRIFFFGKIRRGYVIEAVNPELKMVKWGIIFFLAFMIYPLIMIILLLIYSAQNVAIIAFLLLITLWIGARIVFKIYKKEFPHTKEGKIILREE